ncbi:MAG: hypothetical protein EOM50_07540, partial [Erysipelotrichia bacterium]|nr:hypothetical protein [Erysipelotrichia bacterium]
TVLYNCHENRDLRYITSIGGLFRYMIGDVIRFVDKDRRFEIIGRTKECINLKGEELMEYHINIALQKKHAGTALPRVYGAGWIFVIIYFFLYFIL